MQRLIRFIKGDGMCYVPGDQYEFDPGVAELYVQRGIAEYIDVPAPLVKDSILKALLRDMPEPETVASPLPADESDGHDVSHPDLAATDVAVHMPQRKKNGRPRTIARTGAPPIPVGPDGQPIPAR